MLGWLQNSCQATCLGTSSTLLLSPSTISNLSSPPYHCIPAVKCSSLLVQLKTIEAARIQVDCLLEEGKPLMVIFIPSPFSFPLSQLSNWVKKISCWTRSHTGHQNSSPQLRWRSPAQQESMLATTGPGHNLDGESLLNKKPCWLL